MIRVDIETDDVKKRLGRMTSSIRDRRDVNRLVAIRLYEWVMQNFRREGGLTEARRWKPLAERTKIWKRKHGYALILQNTGQLRNSFVPIHTNDTAGVGARLMGNWQGGRRPSDLAAIHHYGRGRIPARPMLPTERQALPIAVKVYNHWIKTRASK